MAKDISQKDYLKKYLSFGDATKKSKKSKKKSKLRVQTVKVIDDDVDLRNMRPIEDGEFDILNNTEDAPQIVGIVDERGPVDFSDKRKWKIIADDGSGNISVTSGNKTGRDINDLSHDRKFDETVKNVEETRHLKRTKEQKRYSNDGGPKKSSPKSSPKQSVDNDDDDPLSRGKRRATSEETKDHRRSKRDRSSSPKRRTTAEQSKSSRRSDKSKRRSKSPGTSRDHKRMKKTLDGKTAGLQNAQDLKQETEAHKKREAELFSKLSAELSGVGQAAVLRDRKTGKKRDLAAEAAERREKDKVRRELEEKYEKWGKGLKQAENQQEKLKRDLYEMSKPLARYADDADLDRELREQDREGDTLLEYVKQKQVKAGKRKPEHSSSSFVVINRFNLKPGPRWDGVDRSNGYEKKWFDAQNAKKAIQDEAYKWSTADM